VFLTTISVHIPPQELQYILVYKITEY